MGLCTVIELKETKGRLLGVDFGDTRTGLAVSDASRFLASGIGYVSPGGIEKTADHVAGIAREKGVSGIVVGLPRNMDGSEGFRAEPSMFIGSPTITPIAPASLADSAMA